MSAARTTACLHPPPFTLPFPLLPPPYTRQRRLSEKQRRIVASAFLVLELDSETAARVSKGYIQLVKYLENIFGQVEPQQTVVQLHLPAK